MPQFPEGYPRTSALIERLLKLDSSSPESRDAWPVVPPVALFVSYLRTRDVSEPDHWTSFWKRHRARQALYRRQLQRVVEEIGLDLPYVVLKGEPLAEDIFGDGRLRFSSDIDLLIRPKDLDEVLSALQRAGFERQTDKSLDAWGNNQVTAAHQKWGNNVDVHWALADPWVPAPDTGAFLECRWEQSVNDGEFSVPVLEPQANFFYLLYNFHHDAGSAKGLLDICGWLDRYGNTHLGEDFPSWIRKSPVYGVFGWANRTYERLTGSTLVADSPDYPPHLKAPIEAFSRRTAHSLDSLMQPNETTEQAAWAKPLRTLGGTIERGLSLTLFEYWCRRPHQLLWPVILGRHRIGKFVADTLELKSNPR